MLMILAMLIVAIDAVVDRGIQLARLAFCGKSSWWTGILAGLVWPYQNVVISIGKVFCNTVAGASCRQRILERTVNALGPLAEAMDKLTADGTGPQNRKQKAEHQSQTQTQSTAPLTVPWPWFAICIAPLP